MNTGGWLGEKCLKYKRAHRNPLKFTVDGQNRVKLYPEDDEPINILNVKRGVVSTLMVPVMEEDKNDDMVNILTRAQPSVQAQR